MAIITSQVTVTTTRQLIVASDNVSRDVLLHAKHDMHIGNEGVTTSNGFLMDNGDEMQVTIREGEELYAVCATGTGSLSILVSKID